MALIEEAIISGFISKAINNCVDVSWVKIKKIVKNKKYQNIESQIYNIIVSVLNQITCNKYEGDQDKIFQSAEILLVGCKKDNCVNIEIIRSGLQVLEECVNDEKYVQFKVLLYQELSKDDYEELYRVIELWQRDEENSKTVRIEHSVDEVRQGVREIKVVLNEKMENEENLSIIQNVKFQNNKKQDYIKKWNSRLFLHIDNDKNPITLADTFIMPDFEIKHSDQRIGFQEGDTLEKIMDKFLNHDKSSTMLITGVPGIGKTTIVSWIAQKYEKVDNIIILRFRDWETEELEQGLLKIICNTLECKRKDLNDRILILDGFDEMKSLDKRKQILNAFLNDIKDLENSKIMITSRPAYIYSSDFKNNVGILPFDVKKVRLFYQKITGKELNERKVDNSNLDVIGISVILYLAIMLNIDITEKTSKPELYSRIFAEKGGIFDRFQEYDNGSQILRNTENVEKYLMFLQEVAFFMFEKNSQILRKEEIQVPELEFQGRIVSILEFPIRHLFEMSETNIEFIHKSIYEYFVADYIFMLINKAIVANKSKEYLAGILGCALKGICFSEEILEFLKYKIRNTNLNDAFDKVKDAFQLMIQDGMMYYTNEYYKNIMNIEARVFANMLEIMHLWKKGILEFDFSVINYIKHYQERRLNLSRIRIFGVELKYTNLEYADLRYADLSGVMLAGGNLEYADLRGARLKCTSLMRANLKYADLRGADLRWTILERADLRGAIFDEEQIEYLRLKYNLQGTKVYIEKKDEIICYKDYCEIIPNQVSIFDYYEDIGGYDLAEKFRKNLLQMLD